MTRLVYSQVIEKIKQNGFVFDIGLTDNVRTQLFMDRNRGKVKVLYDSYPIRGCGPKSGDWVRVFELNNKLSNESY